MNSFPPPGDAPPALAFSLPSLRKAARPWLPDEDALLGTMTDREVAERVGRSVTSVCSRRHELNIASYQAARRRQLLAWTRTKDRLLGTMADAALAKRLGIAKFRVFLRRQRLGIPAYRGRA